MINLRYHIVSIVAVFLALGIGLALGSTFVDSVLVSNLESQVDQLAADTMTAVDERDVAVALADELVAERVAFELMATPALSAGRFEGTSVVLLAPDTLDRTTIDQVRDLLVGSEAAFGGVMWLTASFDLTDGPTRAALAEEFSLAGNSESAVLRGLTFLMTQALFAPSEAGDSGTEAPRALTVLRDDGLLVYDPSFGGGALNAVGREGLVVVVITDDAASRLNNEVLLPLMQEAVDQGFEGQVALVELDADTGDYGAFVGAVRDDPELAGAISTIDGVTDFEGMLALVSTLDHLPEVGHYGRLPSAQSRLPQ